MLLYMGFQNIKYIRGQLNSNLAGRDLGFGPSFCLVGISWVALAKSLALSGPS